jgi:hypothetical protein
MPAKPRSGIKGEDISGDYSMDDEQQKAGRRHFRRQPGRRTTAAPRLKIKKKQRP